VTVFMSRSAAYGYDQRCEIFGTEGMVSVQNLHETGTVLSDAGGVHLSRLPHSFPQRFRQSFANEMEAFADTVIKGTEWPVTADQCVQVQRVADAAQRSSELDQLVYL